MKGIIVAFLVLVSGISQTTPDSNHSSKPKGVERLTDKEKLDLYTLNSDALSAQLYAESEYKRLMKIAQDKSDKAQMKFYELSAKCGAQLIKGEDGILDCPQRK